MSTHSPITALANDYAGLLVKSERELQKRATTVPDAETKSRISNGFWLLLDKVEKHSTHLDINERRASQSAFRQILIPHLGKSKYFSRSYLKPQGYAGDFRIIEWMYDLEGNAGDNSYQSAFVNCLDYTFSTIHSVQSLWERRRWLATLIESEILARHACGESLKLLDVACGGARYIRDALERIPDHDVLSSVSVTLFDQDIAALQFAIERNLGRFSNSCRAICAPIKSFDSHFAANSFDMVISSGLFDYFDLESAKVYLKKLVNATKPGGLIALTNYHPADGSRSAKDWCADWQLIFKDEEQMRCLFSSSGLDPALSISANGSLVMATARLPLKPQS